MNDPRRWLDDPSVPEAHRRLLMAAVPPPEMSPQAEQGFASLVTQMAAGSAMGKLVAAPLLTKLVVISSSLSVATLAGYLLMQPHRPSALRQVASAEQMSPRTSVELVASQSQPQPATSSSGALLEPEAVRPMRAPATRERTLVTAARESTIRDEAAMLERARQAVYESPLRALYLVDEHAERYPSGQLAAERELIAVQALVRLGRHSDAERRARHFTARFTSSVYQRRMQHILGSSEETTVRP